MAGVRRYGPAIRRALARKAASPREHVEQVALMRRIKLELPVIYEYTTAIPHGGKRSITTAVDLKAEGVRAGYPDILVDLPRGPYHGLRLELKRRDGVPSQVKREQREWGERLNQQGFLAVVGWGADHAFDQVRAYWELGPYDQPELAWPVGTFRLLGHEIEGRRERER